MASRVQNAQATHPQGKGPFHGDGASGLKPEILVGITDGPLYDSLSNNIISLNGDQHKRLRKLLTSLGIHDAHTVRDKLVADALAFFGDMPYADDITLVVLRRLPGRSEELVAAGARSSRTRAAVAGGRS